MLWLGGPGGVGAHLQKVAEAGPGRSWSSGEMGGKTPRTAWRWDARSLSTPLPG